MTASFSESTKPEPAQHKHTLQTSSTTTKPPSPSRTTSDPIGSAPHNITHRGGSDPGNASAGAGGGDDEDNGSDHGITFHKSNDYKFGCVYWHRHGFSLPLPENGRMKLTGDTLTFKGIIGTKISFPLDNVDVTKTPRMGGLVHDAFTVALLKNNNASEEDKGDNNNNMFLFSIVLKDRKKVVDKIQAAMAHVKLRKEEEEFDVISGRGGKKGSDGSDHAKKKKFRMPPDTTLQKMKIIGSTKLKGVSLQDYYDVAWVDNKHGPMYGPFLESQGKNNVTVQEWKSGQQFEGEWCGESYTEQRVVSFNFMKQTIGQTLVEVKHTQQFRRVGDDQIIVQIKMEMKGFPYADCFVVQVRHVVSRFGDTDLSIQIGMFVKFLKSCMFESKIKTNTGSETTKAQLALLEMTVKGCAPFAKEVEEGTPDESEDEDELETTLTAQAPPSQEVRRGAIKLPEPVVKVLRHIVVAFVIIFRACLRPYLPPKLFEPIPPDNVRDSLADVRVRMKELEEISLKSASDRRKTDVSREIALIKKSLERIQQITSKKN